MSEQCSEGCELSSQAEMQALVHEAADLAAPTGNWKDRVQAAARALGFSWARTKAFYYQDARQVNAEEMDRARARIRELKRAAERTRAADHIAWLRSTLERHRETGEGMDGQTLDALEHLVRQARAVGGPVVVAAEDQDQSVNWG